MKRVLIGFVLSFLILVLFVIPSEANQGQKDKPAKLVTQAEINRAIKKGVDYLKKQQRKGGEWSPKTRGGMKYEIGTVALASYTLLKCGLSPKDKAVASSLKYLLNKPVSGPRFEGGTYRTSLIAMAMATALEKGKSKKSGRKISKKYYQKLKEAVDWLIKAQHPSQRRGWAWGYVGPELWGKRKGKGGFSTTKDYWDNSCTQFAILGLRAAQNLEHYKLGFKLKVPKSVWKKALAHLISTQNKDGSWEYQQGRGGGLSMTAAGICGMIICLASIEKKPDLDKIIKTKEISNAIKWLEEYWFRNIRGSYYWLYSLERACMLGRIKKIGDHDWYQEGAVRLISAQNQDGSWHRGEHSDIVDTCFALLFLKRAYIPVITPSGHQLKPIITDKPEPPAKSPESSPKEDDKK